jgi:hypothetical protein
MDPAEGQGEASVRLSVAPWVSFDLKAGAQLRLRQEGEERPSLASIFVKSQNSDVIRLSVTNNLAVDGQVAVVVRAASPFGAQTEPDLLLEASYVHTKSLKVKVKILTVVLLDAHIST